MDYFTVALTANLTASIATASLFILLVFQSLSQMWKRFLVVGVFGQFIWISALLTRYYSDVGSNLLLHIELLRFTCWLVCLLSLLMRHTPWTSWPKRLQSLSILSISTIIIAALAINLSDSSVTSIRLSLMLLATCNLVFTEQVVRNLNSHRMIKLIGLCLTFLFAYDVLFFGQGLLTNNVPPITLQGRSALAFTIAVALAIGSIIFNERDDNKYLFTVSRPAAFFSTALVLSGLLFSIVVVGLLYVSDKGYLATYLFSLLLVISLLILISLLISRSFRQHFEVFVSKHFFSLKYDYRIEWLKAIRKSSELKSDDPEYYERVLRIVQSAVRAKSGSLWISNGSEFKEITSNLSLPDVPETISVNEAFIRTMLKEAWIYAPHSRETSLSANNHLLPEWIRKNNKTWLVVPLIIQMRLVGFVILSKPSIETEITFEDRDLMTNISTQVASSILLHKQEKLISDAKQLETYNRLSAFIMHDINNVIAQLALIGKNAERHKKNPAFIDDMIKTVHNATTRMQSLIQKFNPASKESRNSIPASILLLELKEVVSDYLPKLQVNLKNDFSIDADKHRLILAIKNLVRNSQEATRKDGTVSITAVTNKQGNCIIVQDTGHGMSQRFINEELFRPFITTKEENGIGIGVYLTKSYIEHLGASLTVSSKVDEGTKFEITFN